MNSWEKKLTYAGLSIWALFLFVSLSLCALGHILLFFPVLFSIYRRIKDKNFFKLPQSTIILFLIFFWGIISVIANWNTMLDPWQHILKLKYFFFGFGMVSLFLEYFSDPIEMKRSLKLLPVFVFSTTLASLSGLIGLWSGFNPLRWKKACHIDRACGMNGMYMTYGYGIGAYVVAQWGFLNSKKLQMNKYLKYLGIFLNILGLFFAKARGSLISAFIAIPFYFLKRSMKYFILSFALLISSFVLMVSFNPRVREIFYHPLRLESNNIRISLFKAAYYGFKDNPIVGLGFKNFEPNVKKIKNKYNLEYPEFQGHAHNNFLEHLVSMGLVGFLLIVLFHFFWIKELWNRKSVFFPFSIYILCSGLTQYTLGDAQNSFLIMLFYALSQVVQVNDENRI